MRRLLSSSSVKQRLPLLFRRQPRNKVEGFQQFCRWNGDPLGSEYYHSQQQQKHFSTNGNSNSPSHPKKPRPDPFARRPTAKCDPYGQGGKPLPPWEAQTLLATLHPNWTITKLAAPTEDASSSSSSSSSMPQKILRDFVHPDFMAGARFVSKIAAIAQMENQHYPAIGLGRRIVPHKKEWEVVTRVECYTLVLGGLSTHDFHLATVRNGDVKTKNHVCVSSCLFGLDTY